MKNLTQKYNVPGPRYTSYPTVPFWNDQEFSKEKWITSFKETFHLSNQKEGISIYIHLPFCESLCTFCACHKHITKQHDKESPYIQAVLKEWLLYKSHMNETPIIKEIHLGGGTPTFFSPESLEILMKGILSNSILHSEYEFSFEGHPNNTSKEHLITLFNLGFTRVSFGVQDYNENVQNAIHRVQSFEQVKKVTELARNIGYSSISHDIIFGLPHQNLDCVTKTITKTKELLPDRISFYSYAHVPWIKGVGQRGFDNNDLPSGKEKRILYEVGKKLLLELGYVEVGMDHFSLPTDTLFKASKNKKLHRNFMGYTSQKTDLMIGLGMSAISDSWSAFAQNVKTVKEYEMLVNKGDIPIFRGHILSDIDLEVRQHILNLMCQFETKWIQNQEIQINKLLIREIEQDGLIKSDALGIQIYEEGKPFVRNVCMALDQYLLSKEKEQQLFSMTV